MMSKALRVGNQVVFVEHVCGVEYKRFADEDVQMVGYKSMLIVYTVDGRSVMFKNEEADVIWNWAKAASVDLGALKP